MRKHCVAYEHDNSGIPRHSRYQLAKPGVDVEKARDRNVFPAVKIAPVELFLSLQLRGGFHGGYRRLAEEADTRRDVVHNHVSVICD